MALDDAQRQLETVKLCIDYLKHLTTISGVAVVVVLALLERPGADTWALAGPALFFGLAVVLCLLGIVLLIIGVAANYPGRLDDLAVAWVCGVTGMVAVTPCNLLMGAFLSAPLARTLVSGGPTIVILVASAYVIKRLKTARP